MTILTRYILRQLAAATVIVTLALLVIIWLTQSLRFVEMIVNHGQTLGVFLRLTVMLLPSFLVIVLPIAVFAVVLFVYNKLSTDRELVVMRSAGTSQTALARPALILALAAAAVSALMSYRLQADASQEFHDMQLAIRNNLSSVLLEEGAFTSLGEGITVYVRARTAKGELLGILVHDAREPKHAVTMMAERGALVDTPEGPRVVMVNGNRQEVQPGGKLSMLYFDRYTFDLSDDTKAESIRREPRELTLSELFRVTPKEFGERDYGRYRVEAHQRLLAPVYNVTFTLIALASLISGTFKRRGQGERVIVGVALMIAVQVGAFALTNAAAKTLALIPLLYVAAILPIPIAWYVIQRAPRRNPEPAPPGLAQPG